MLKFERTRFLWLTSAPKYLLYPIMGTLLIYFFSCVLFLDIFSALVISIGIGAIILYLFLIKDRVLHRNDYMVLSNDTLQLKDGKTLSEFYWKDIKQLQIKDVNAIKSLPKRFLIFKTTDDEVHQYDIYDYDAEEKLILDLWHNVVTEPQQQTPILTKYRKGDFKYELDLTFIICCVSISIMCLYGCIYYGIIPENASKSLGFLAGFAISLLFGTIVSLSAYQGRNDYLALDGDLIRIKIYDQVVEHYWKEIKNIKIEIVKRTHSDPQHILSLETYDNGTPRYNIFSFDIPHEDIYNMWNMFRENNGSLGNNHTECE